MPEFPMIVFSRTSYYYFLPSFTSSIHTRTRDAASVNFRGFCIDIGGREILFMDGGGGSVATPRGIRVVIASTVERQK